MEVSNELLREVTIANLTIEYVSNCLENGATKEEALAEVKTGKAIKEILKRADEIVK